jgi:hypothetical protein
MKKTSRRPLLTPSSAMLGEYCPSDPTAASLQRAGDESNGMLRAEQVPRRKAASRGCRDRPAGHPQGTAASSCVCHEGGHVFWCLGPRRPDRTFSARGGPVGLGNKGSSEVSAKCSNVCIFMYMCVRHCDSVARQDRSPSSGRYLFSIEIVAFVQRRPTLHMIRARSGVASARTVCWKYELWTRYVASSGIAARNESGCFRDVSRPLFFEQSMSNCKLTNISFSHERDVHRSLSPLSGQIPETLRDLAQVYICPTIVCVVWPDWVERIPRHRRFRQFCF